MEKYYPAWRRRVRYMLSFLFSLPFLSLGVGAMILSLNLNGYIHDKESPIYFASLSRFAEPVSIKPLLLTILETFVKYYMCLNIKVMKVDTTNLTSQNDKEAWR